MLDTENQDQAVNAKFGDDNETKQEENGDCEQSDLKNRRQAKRKRRKRRSKKQMLAEAAEKEKLA